MSLETKKKILVVDDNDNWLKTIEIILAAEYDLTLSKDPSNAIELVTADAYDLVILDKNFPAMSGLEVLRQMRDILNNLLVIMLTGYADIESAVESKKLGAVDYLSKGAGDLSSELKVRVRVALERPQAADEYSILALIAKGEYAELEFKSSARWDIRANKLNRDLEMVIVKTVAAFLNSETGGTLLIGVDDNGTVVGLQQDYQTLGKKQDSDGYGNFLTTLLLECYGKDCNPLIQITFHRITEKDICRIVAKPSPKAVFVRDGKGGDHLFIRTGNSTRQLTTREAIEYCKIRWNQ
jgi:DNA-binding response OmpR family regulator